MFKKTAAVLLMVSVSALSFTACRARERYLVAEQERLDSMPLVCSEDFGLYYFDPGWTECGSGNSHVLSYCLKEDLDDPDRPYTVTVTYETNEYSHEEGYTFGSIEYPVLAEEYGEDNVTITGCGGCNDNGFASFEIVTDGAQIYRWYILGDYEQVLFEITAEDDDYVQENGLYTDVFSAVGTFHFDR